MSAPAPSHSVHTVNTERCKITEILHQCFTLHSKLLFVSYNTGKDQRHPVEELWVAWLDDIQTADEVWQQFQRLKKKQMWKKNDQRFDHFIWFDHFRERFTSVTSPSRHKECKASIRSASGLFLSFCKSLKHDTSSILLLKELGFLRLVVIEYCCRSVLSFQANNVKKEFTFQRELWSVFDCYPLLTTS